MFPTDFLKESDVRKGSAVFKHYENILAIKYRAAKNKLDGKPKVVHLLSTKHNAAMKNTSKTDHDGNTIQKPDAIIYYSKNMGGVDKIDQQLDSINYHQKVIQMVSQSLLLDYLVWQC